MNAVDTGKYYIHNKHVGFEVSNFEKTGANFSFGTKCCKLVILGEGHQFQVIY